jgi:hypothetical protein
MIRHCDGTDPNLLTTPCGPPCACGRRFDDEYRSVVFPHRPLPPPMTTGQLDALHTIRQVVERQTADANRLRDLCKTANKMGVPWRVLGEITGINYASLFRRVQAGSPVTPVRMYQQ